MSEFMLAVSLFFYAGKVAPSSSGLTEVHQPIGLTE